MKKITLVAAALFTAGSLYLAFHSAHAPSKIQPAGDPMEDDALERFNWEVRRLADPATGKIPDHIRQKELAFAATLPSDAGVANARMSSQAAWSQRGPWNVGGRTRAFAIDATNDNHFIAGTTSGGLWGTTDGGTSWNELLPKSAYHGVSCLKQDQRSGHTSTWYSGSGEAYGQSASGGSAYFLGDGMMKSTDNGATWQQLTSTVTNSPQSFTFWDMIWNVALDQHDTVNDVVYTALLGGIYKSTNGGTNWAAVRGGSTSAYSYFTDVACTRDSGIVYATLSSDGPVRGIWRSTDQGATWAHISNSFFGDSLCNRVVIGINPSNENELYFLGNSNGLGTADTNFLGDVEYNTLWRYTYLGGDGSGSGGQWEDLSPNMPQGGVNGPFGDFNAQGSYDLIVRVKPDDPNTVFIGGTNIYRSTNKFSDNTSTSYIGGYQPGTTLPVVISYTDHHPDQHLLSFLPSNPNVMISCNDGGIFKTTDCMAATVAWTPLNNGYLTSMFYTCAIDHATAGNNIIVGGAQDNGSWYTNSANLQTPWVSPRGGDGSYCAIADNQSMYYFSIQNGKMGKVQLDGSGNVVAQRRIDPIGGEDYQFINPFALDPNNNNIMYLAGGKYLWRNDDLSQIPLSNQWDSISTNWVKWNDSVPLANSTITAVTVCKTPANRVYYGTDKKRVFRVNNANVGTPTPVDITANTFANAGYVSCIAVDPNNGDHVMVVFSNYSIYSLFYSSDGGTTWNKVAGNLEQNVTTGSGNGPSCRWATIMPVSDGYVYLVATSTGLYATDTLNGTNTVWVQQGANTIGNLVCDMLDARVSDGRVVLATHGAGIFSATITSVNDIVSVHNLQPVSMQLDLFPNPTNSLATLRYSLDAEAPVRMRLLDELGREVRMLDQGKQGRGEHSITIDRNGLATGLYYVSLQYGDAVETRKLVFSN